MPDQLITTRPCLSPTFNQSNSAASKLAPQSLFDIVYGMLLFTILDLEKKEEKNPTNINANVFLGNWQGFSE